MRIYKSLFKSNEKKLFKSLYSTDEPIDKTTMKLGFTDGNIYSITLANEPDVNYSAFTSAVQTVILENNLQDETLTAMTLTANLDIDDNAFEDYISNLEDFTFGSKVRKINVGANVFAESQLTYFDAAKVSSFGSGCFYNCQNLTNVENIDVETIPDSCFEKCTNLSINYPSAKNIGEKAFADSGLYGNVSIESSSTVGDYAFKNCNISTLALNRADVSGYSFSQARISTLEVYNGNDDSSKVSFNDNAFNSAYLSNVKIYNWPIIDCDQQVFANITNVPLIQCNYMLDKTCETYYHSLDNLSTASVLDLYKVRGYDTNNAVYAQYETLPNQWTNAQKRNIARIDFSDKPNGVLTTLTQLFYRAYSCKEIYWGNTNFKAFANNKFQQLPALETLTIPTTVTSVTSGFTAQIRDSLTSIAFEDGSTSKALYNPTYGSNTTWRITNGKVLTYTRGYLTFCTLATNNADATDLSSAGFTIFSSYSMAMNEDSTLALSQTAQPVYIQTLDLSAHDYTFKANSFANQKYADITISDNSTVEDYAFYEVYNVNYNGSADTSNWGCLNINHQPNS